jgi:hypothetical protein
VRRYPEGKLGRDKQSSIEMVKVIAQANSPVAEGAIGCIANSKMESCSSDKISDY